ncbi:rod shape-determining protein RodA [bacterium]|nr:rod shape-determining protein RodA [bacterium]
MRELIDRKLFSSFDWQFYFLILSISLIGILFVYSATSSSSKILKFYEAPFGKQIIWVILGSILFFLSSVIDYHLYARISTILYFLLLLLLISVFIFGSVTYGSKRWIDFGFFKIQPSEFAKIIIILTLSRYFASKKNLYLRIIDIIFTMIVVGIPFLLIFEEPDLGTAFLLLPIFFFYIFICKNNLKYFAIFIILGSAFSIGMWFNLKDYQITRIKSFLNPDYDKLGAGYQIVQSKIAVGSGGFFGKGFKAGTQAQLDFLPAQHTDFIFSVIAEEFGFIGAFILLLMFILLIIRGINICLKAKDNLAIFIGSGILLVLTMNITINVFVVLGLFPVTGLPLPLVSYGGSSMLTTMFCLGIIESIKIYRFHF